MYSHAKRPVKSLVGVVSDLLLSPRGRLGAGHQTPAAQKEAAAGSAGPRLRGGG